MGKNIGFVSTRFAGTDGVTLEASKWADVFERSGYHCFWFAGELDRNPQMSHLVPEAHFLYPRNVWINNRIWGHKGRNRSVTETIHDLRSLIKEELYAFVERFDIGMLIAENALTIPMHIPLGLALSETIAETQIPTIAHHHDFYWERVRFAITAVSDYLRMAFPPHLPNVEHVVINSAAREELAHRKGISATVIPNVLDFETPPRPHAKRAEVFRQFIGLAADDIVILQPTRIIQRKGIEHTIQLVRELNNSHYKLVISHEAGDEGYEYSQWLVENASKQGVDLRVVPTRLEDPLNTYSKTCGRHEKQFSLWDVYPHADFITYPSLSEGFGNAFLEAIYFKKPILINRYANFIRDIEPLGFDLIQMNGFLTDEIVQRVKEILNSTRRKQKMVDFNYEIAARYFSYNLLRNRLNAALSNFFGISDERLGQEIRERPPQPPMPPDLKLAI